MSEGPFPQVADASVFTHRRSTVNVGNPALILHRAYQIPAGEIDAQWREAIVEFATKVQANLCRISRTETSRESFNPATLDSLRHCTFRAELNHSAKSRVGISFSIDILDEIWTWKLAVDFSRCAEPQHLEGNYAKLFNALDDIENLIRTRVESSKIERTNGRALSLEREETGESADRQLAKIRTSLKRAIETVRTSIVPKDAISAAGNAVPAQQVPCNDPGDGFADFVGLSLAVPAYIEDNDLEQPDLFEIQPESRIERIKFHNVFDNIRAELRIPKTNPRLMQLVDSIWPVAVNLILNRQSSSDRRGRSARKRRPTEFAISRMNRGRALHVTSLGSGFDSTASSEQPLVYLLLCPHNATWQIGRMIDRIHYLAIFRAAAIFAHAAIDKANDSMRRLIDQIEQNGNVSVIRTKFDNHIRRILISRADRDREEGLHYRLEWSRYYLKTYRSLLSGTSFERVEGYQTYEEFVKRRLDFYFEAIDNASRRFQYVSRLLSEKENQRTSEDSRHLLEGAEVVSIIPVSYYSYHILHYLNKWISNSFGTLLPWAFQWFWFLSVVLFCCVVASRIYKRRKGRPLWRTLFRFLWHRLTTVTRSPPSATSAPPAPARRRARGRA